MPFCVQEMLILRCIMRLTVWWSYRCLQYTTCFYALAQVWQGTACMIG